MSRRKVCAWCGLRCKGYARIDDDWYCHGDDDSFDLVREPEPTCYELASSARNAEFWAGRRRDPEWQRRAALVDAALSGAIDTNPMTIDDVAAVLGLPPVTPTM